MAFGPKKKNTPLVLAGYFNNLKQKTGDIFLDTKEQPQVDSLLCLIEIRESGKAYGKVVLSNPR